MAGCSATRGLLWTAIPPFRGASLPSSRAFSNSVRGAPSLQNDHTHTLFLVCILEWAEILLPRSWMSSSHLRFPPLLWFALLILVAGLVLFSQTWAWHGDE